MSLSHNEVEKAKKKQPTNNESENAERTFFFRN